MLDKLSDKIDYMFRHGKNADERCFDYFLRTITFFVILLAVLFYGSFVNADELENEDNFSTFTEGFTYDNYNSWVSANNLDTTNFTSIGIMQNQTYNQDVFNSTNFANLPYPTDVSVFNNPTVLGIGSGGGTINSSSNRWGVKYCVGNGNILISGADGGVYAYSDQPFNVFHTQLNNNLTMYDNWGWESFNASLVTSNYDGVTTCYRALLYSTFNQSCWCNCPYYTFSVPVDGWNASYDLIYAFVNFPDNWININYEYATQFPDEPDIEVETNENHLFLNDIQVGITSNNVGQDILSSSVVIGVDPDDWIVNNPDDFKLGVTYTLHFKDTMPSTPNDPTKAYGVMLPIRTFFNQNYSYGIAEIFRNMDMLNYYNSLSEGGVKIITDFTYKALLPSPLKAFEQTLGQYICDQMGATEEILNPYTVFDATLTVDCVLVDTVSGEMSHRYIKEFDFIHGTESVKNADILKNYNPWEGEQTPQQSPIVPSAGGSVGGYSGGGNTNVSVNVSGQKVPMNVKNKQEIERALDAYTEVTDHFNNLWNDLANQNSNSNFLNVIHDTTEEIPYMDYMIKCALVIFGMAVILFALKVLLF